MLCRTINFLANSLELSNCAAALVGPNIFRPAARKSFTIPSANGVSGPTMVRYICSRCANAIRSAVAMMSTFFTPLSSAVPALPGATYTTCTLAACAKRQASACSLPPPPITKIFIVPPKTYKNKRGKKICSGRGRSRSLCIASRSPPSNFRYHNLQGLTL